ncbi:MAG TPA: hypothetical protein EYP31_01485 [Roseibacterium sp.]|nr:hypothetical protein [Roseibacterium sp.]
MINTAGAGAVTGQVRSKITTIAGLIQVTSIQVTSIWHRVQGNAYPCINPETLLPSGGWRGRLAYEQS